MSDHNKNPQNQSKCHSMCRAKLKSNSHKENDMLVRVKQQGGEANELELLNHLC